MQKRVRHHTDDRGLMEIQKANAIAPGRGWGTVEIGVHVEVKPFGSARPSPWDGPKADLGCDKEGAFVEFNAPERMMSYYCGPRNSAVIPVPANQLLSLNELDAVFVKVRVRWWQFWRTRAK